MDSFEEKLSAATNHKAREILGALGLVVDREGSQVYSFASGCQSLKPDSPPLTLDNTLALGSAGKFTTHIAALQCVEKGLVTLDGPLDFCLPELNRLPIISKNEGPDAAEMPFSLREPTKKITLRQLLTHSSGIASPGDGPLLEAWEKSDMVPKPNDEDPIIVQMFSMPLLFEPGEGCVYGSSVEWASLLVSRLTGQRLAPYVKEHIFDPLGMTSSTYIPKDHPDISTRLLQTVRRDGDQLLPADGAVGGLVTSAADLGRLLADLIAPASSRVLQRHSVDLLFAPQFGPGTPALADLRGDTENYAAPAGIPPEMADPPVNFSLGGLFVEALSPLSLSGLPAGTTTWNGMPNVIWAVNRDRGLATFFATQLLPVDDEKTVDIAMLFMKSAWTTFGSS